MTIRDYITETSTRLAMVITGVHHQINTADGDVYAEWLKKWMRDLMPAADALDVLSRAADADWLNSPEEDLDRRLADFKANLEL